jgi:hypothetical protein
MKKVLEKPGRLRKVLVEGASYKTLWKNKEIALDGKDLKCYF